MTRMSNWCMLRVCAWCGIIYGWKPGWGKTHGACERCYGGLVDDIRALSKRQKWGKKNG